MQVCCCYGYCCCHWHQKESCRLNLTVYLGCMRAGATNLVSCTSTHADQSHAPLTTRQFKFKNATLDVFISNTPNLNTLRTSLLHLTKSLNDWPVVDKHVDGVGCTFAGSVSVVRLLPHEDCVADLTPPPTVVYITHINQSVYNSKFFLVKYVAKYIDLIIY